MEDVSKIRPLPSANLTSVSKPETATRRVQEDATETKAGSVGSDAAVISSELASSTQGADEQAARAENVQRVKGLVQSGKYFDSVKSEDVAAALVRDLF